MLEDRRTRTYIMLALCALYIAVRVWRLSDSCLWFDEIFSVHAAEHDWGSLFDFVAQDLIHPPLFYIILKIWIGVGGESLFWLRLLPVIFSVAALIPFYLLCLELKQGFWTIALAVFLLAVNGTFIKYAQLLRMYSMLMCLSLLSIWLFARYFNRGKNLTVLIVVNLLLVYTHYYGWLVVGTEVFAIAIFQRYKWRGIAVMAGILSLLFLPWFYVVFRSSQTGTGLGENVGWIKRPGFAEVGTYIIDLIEPFFFQVSNAEPASIYSVSISLLLIAATAAAFYISRFRNEASEQQRTIYLIMLFSFLPIVAVLVASWLLPYSIWGTRHLIIVAGPLTLLIAIILTKFDGGRLPAIAVTLVVVFSAYAFFIQASKATTVYVWCAWDRIADEIASGASDEEQGQIYTFENLSAYHLWFATRNSDRVKISVVKGVQGMHEDESYFLPRGFNAVRRMEISEIRDDRAWLVFRTEKFGQENTLIETLVKQGYIACPANPARYGMTNVFKIEIVKPPVSCSQ